MAKPKDPEQEQGRVEAEPKRRIQLPASGLAKDILAMVRQGGAEDTRATGEPSAPEATETWVALAVGRRSFALPALAVREVVRVESLTPVPLTPPVVRGLATVRGRPVTVLDLGLRLGILDHPTEVTPASRILAIDHRSRSLGLLVDSIGQVINLLPSRIRQAERPANDPKAEDALTVGRYGTGAEEIVLLDMEGLIALE